MSSSKFRGVLLAAFVVLTIVFGSISVYEYIQVQQTTTITLPPSTTFTVTTSTETQIFISVITYTATVPYVPDEGEIEICFPNKTDCYFFAYKRMSGFPQGTSVTFKNVNFYSMPLTGHFTGCVEYNVTITFADGTSELHGAGYCGPDARTSIAFTDYKNPTAGVMYAPNDYSVADGGGAKVISQPVTAGFYLLVSRILPD
jgi:hypothetical protein